jgi:hypothetical protein
LAATLRPVARGSDATLPPDSLVLKTITRPKLDIVERLAMFLNHRRKLGALKQDVLINTVAVNRLLDEARRIYDEGKLADGGSSIENERQLGSLRHANSPLRRRYRATVDRLIELISLDPPIPTLISKTRQKDGVPSLKRLKDLRLAKTLRFELSWGEVKSLLSSLTRQRAEMESEFQIALQVKRQIRSRDVQNHQSQEPTSSLISRATNERRPDFSYNSE